MREKKRRKAKTAGCVAMILCAFAILAALSAIYAQIWSQNKRYVLYYTDEIIQSSQQYGLDPYLVSAMIYCESSFQATLFQA
jgi:soluble lytic murein transglycosylase-like protein